MRVIRRRPRVSNSDRSLPRLLSVANVTFDDSRRERLQRRAKRLVDHDAAVREARYFFRSMELLASAVPESMTRDEIMDAASRVKTLRRKVIALKTDIPDTKKKILRHGWQHAVLRVPRHRGLLTSDFKTVWGWSWHAPDMPSIGRDGIPPELVRLMGGETAEFMRYREALKRLDGRQSKHAQEALIQEIVALREADTEFMRRFIAVECGRQREGQSLAVQNWHMTAGGDDELAAVADRQSVRIVRRRPKVVKT